MKTIRPIHSLVSAALAASFALSPAAPAKDADDDDQANSDQPAMADDQAQEQTYLGLGTASLPSALVKHLHLDANSGVLVESVDPDSPAAKAGFAEDDIITKIDGTSVNSHRELAKIVQAKNKGDSIELDYIHDGKAAKRTVTLGSHKPDPNADDAGDGQFGAAFANLPPEMQKHLREALNRAGANPGIHGMNLQLGNGGVQILPGPNGPGIHGGVGRIQIQGNAAVSSGSVSMADGDGSVEMKTVNGASEVRVRDKIGKEIWSGPWETEQDKAAAPQDVRQRIEKLNLMPGALDLNIQGGHAEAHANAAGNGNDDPPATPKPAPKHAKPDQKNTPKANPE